MLDARNPWQLVYRLSRIVFLGLVLYLGWILVVVQPDLARRLMLPPAPKFPSACQRFPNVKVVTSSLEEWEPQQEQFDAVLAATSFHWIPPEIAYPKAAGPLWENGWLILLWNKELQPPIQTHEALRAIVRRHAPELERPCAATVAGILMALGQPLLESPLFPGAHRGQCWWKASCRLTTT
jgi:hypothetical protein